MCVTSPGQTKNDTDMKLGTLIFFISTWPNKHMKAFFEKIKRIAHEGFCRKNKHITSTIWPKKGFGQKVQCNSLG